MADWNELKPLLVGPPLWTLAVAESLTSGWVQAGIGSVSGASEFFLGGMTAYTLGQKVRHLGVDRATAESTNSVSERTAREMARGACALFGSDLAIATTGYAEPTPSGEAPFAWWALAHRSGAAWIERAGRVSCPTGARVDVQQEVANAVLRELTNYLRERRPRLT